jgi:hypothetical protein
MRWYDVEQNTDLWLDIRPGKLTGSNIAKVMANYGKAFGDPAKRLASVIACEQATGKRNQIDNYSNEHMERGHVQEPLARKLYEDTYFVDVTNGGFYDCGRVGFSPDGRVNNDGLIEIKSVIIPAHISTIKRNKVDPSYKWQNNFNLAYSDRKWIDFVSYCYDFPEQTRLFVHRTTRDDITEEIKMMDNRINEFFDLVETEKKIILGK